MNYKICKASLLGLAVIASPAFAGTATTVMPVTALVVENCAIAATPMAFGTLTNFGAANVDSTATLSLVCTPNADFDVALDNGSNALGGNRRLKNPLSAEYINYDVFLDVARSQHWGSNTGTNTVPGTAPLGLATYTAYGRIPAGVSSVGAGVYEDIVTVTVTF